MPLSIVDIMNFTNYFSVLSQKDTVDSRLQASVKTTNVVLLKITNSWRRRKMEVNL